jgi:hypothetical protein
MIDHLFIKNYKGIKRKNIPLNQHNLIIGSSKSGKTSVLLALDLFFNNVIDQRFIIDRDEPIIIEIHMDERRYRKVFIPPYFDLDIDQSIGNLHDLCHLNFVLISKMKSYKKIEDEFLSHEIKRKILNDATLLPINIETIHLKLRAKHHKTTDLLTLLKQHELNQTIIAIDDIEHLFSIEELLTIKSLFKQTIFTSSNTDVINTYDLGVFMMFDDLNENQEIIRKRATDKKLSLLVEGKYDVSWYEKAIDLLEYSKHVMVIPCGGSSNTEVIEKQLKKEGIKTVIMTDGDMNRADSIKRDVVEMYTDINYLKRRFHVRYKKVPTDKKTFFQSLHVPSDVAKKILAAWARHHLSLENPFVSEVKKRIEEVL